jgi:Max protein
VDKRAHHNALERKRRDHIKESFTGLRDAIPTLAAGDKSSRAQILKKASDYIR